MWESIHLYLNNLWEDGINKQGLVQIIGKKMEALTSKFFLDSSFYQHVFNVKLCSLKHWSYITLIMRKRLFKECLTLATLRLVGFNFQNSHLAENSGSFCHKIAKFRYL